MRVVYLSADMDLVIIAIVACGASLLTFYSGFGLGTMLLPVFVLFFPIDLAIALTAIVHFLNGIFKTGLIGKLACRKVVLKFGIPALLFAFLGARLLMYLSSFPVNYQYKIAGISAVGSPVKIVIGLLLLIFAIAEILPERPKKRKPNLHVGGALSGFFGGLSGHQGALRTAFLIRLGLTKEVFIASGIVISLMIDVSRLGVYWSGFSFEELRANWVVLLVAALAAFVGAFIGRRLLKKVTLRFVQYVVAVGIAVIALLLIVGIL